MEKTKDKDLLELGVVVHTCNPSVHKAKEGRWTISKNACYPSMRICIWVPSTHVKSEVLPHGNL